MSTIAYATLTLTGPDADLRRFVAGLGEGTVDEHGNRSWSIMDSYLPCPDALTAQRAVSPPPPMTPDREACLRAYGFPTWYERNLAVWGTKWEETFDIRVESGAVTVALRSKWAPPLAGLATILYNRFPALAAEIRWDDDSGDDITYTCRLRGDDWFELDDQRADDQGRQGSVSA